VGVSWRQSGPRQGSLLSVRLFRKRATLLNVRMRAQAKPTKRRWHASSRRSCRSEELRVVSCAARFFEKTHLKEQVRCRVLDFVAVGTDERVELHCYLVDMLDAPVLAEHSAFQWVGSSSRMSDLGSKMLGLLLTDAKKPLEGGRERG
jgi:hypothetical protein